MNNKLNLKTILGKKIYCFDKKYFEILEDILNLKYEIMQEYKNDNRTYVAKIK